MSASYATSDRQRFGQWFQQHGCAVRGYLWATLRDLDLADDLVQEVFRRAWQARTHYQEHGHARAYLMRIADRLVCDLRRKKRLEVQLDDVAWKLCEPVSTDRDPSERLAYEESCRQLGEALDQLTAAQRRVLLLRFFGQCSFQEIASMMECPLNTVLSHGRRGLIALRGMMAEELT